MKGKIILGCFAFLAVMIVLFMTGTIQNYFIRVFNPNYLIVKNGLLYKDKDGWQEASLGSDELGEALKKKYTVYADEVYNNVKLGYQSGNWFLLDGENASKINNFRCASVNKNIKRADYNLSLGNSEDDEIVVDAISYVGGSFTKPYDYQKIVYDFDNDGTREIIYYVTNISLDPDSYIPKSVVFMVKNGNTSIIEKSNLYRFDIEEVFDLNNDGSYEMIVSKAKKANDKEYDTCYQIYGFKDNVWKKIKKCKV